MSDKEYPNKLLVDCFLKLGEKYLIIKRKESESSFPGVYASVWKIVQPNSNPYESLQKIFDELNINPKNIKLKAIANNVFHDLKETYNVLLFIVEIDEKIEKIDLKESDAHQWITYEELLKKDDILEEYKKIFPLFSDDKVLYYHTEYDVTKILKHEVYN